MTTETEDEPPKPSVYYIRYVVALAAVVGAIFLAWHGKEGWGWLIFIAWACL